MLSTADDLVEFSVWFRTQAGIPWHRVATAFSEVEAWLMGLKARRCPGDFAMTISAPYPDAKAEVWTRAAAGQPVRLSTARVGKGKARR
jgi:hypothetical protein